MDASAFLLPLCLVAVVLPPPGTGGRPLMDVLADRHTAREFAPEPLAAQELSDLLWAAAGVNRPESGKRTVPSARNWQEVDVYVVTADGVSLYLPAEHRLEPLLEGDLRPVTGRQDFVATAPLDLVYVADTDRMEGCPPDLVDLYSGADTAFMAQNVYLWYASAGLNCVMRGAIDRDAIHAALRLRPAQRVTFAMTVGHRPQSP